MYGNPSLSKLCRKNPIRNVVGWYKMSFMVYFEFWLSWFWFGRKIPVKRAIFGNFCVLLDTPTPKRRCGAPPRRRSLLLGELEAEFFEFSGPPKRRNPCLGEPLRLGKPLRLGVALLCLGQATVPVLFFLWLILESVTLLFGLPMEDI